VRSMSCRTMSCDEMHGMASSYPLVPSVPGADAGADADTVVHVFFVCCLRLLLCPCTNTGRLETNPSQTFLLSIKAHLRPTNIRNHGYAANLMLSHCIALYCIPLNPILLYTYYTRSHPTGTSLYEACETNEVELGPAGTCGVSEVVRSDEWTEPVFGDGPTSGFDHVVLSGAGVDTAAPMTRSEERMIEHYWDFDEIFPESRLATEIKLTGAMDGMIVYVPPRIDDTNP